MTYKSKYYALEKHGPKWKKEEFAWVVEKLETASMEKLLEICRDSDIELTFTGDDWEKTIDDEQIISALITDYPPVILIPVIKKYLGE